MKGFNFLILSISFLLTVSSTTTKNALDIDNTDETLRELLEYHAQLLKFHKELLEYHSKMQNEYPHQVPKVPDSLQNLDQELDESSPSENYETPSEEVEIEPETIEKEPEVLEKEPETIEKEPETIEIEPETHESVGDWFPEDLWKEIFYQVDNPACKGSQFFKYRYFVKAADSLRRKGFLNSGDRDMDKIELAAFLAETSHETTGGWGTAKPSQFHWGYCFWNEIRGGQYCDYNAYGNCQNDGFQCECTPGKEYHGRGPIQLSWNYNYGRFSKQYFGDYRLLERPEILSEDPSIGFAAAIWFWMTPQYSKPSCHDVITGRIDSKDVGGRETGYGLVTNIINGGLECNRGYTTRKENDRIGFYNRYLEILGVNDFRKKSCSSMMSF